MPRTAFRRSLLLIILGAFLTTASCALAQTYKIEQVTTDAQDHRWPALNNNGDMVWCQQVGGKWHVFKMAAGGSPVQITSTDNNHMFPAIDDAGEVVYFEDGGSGGVGWRVVRYPDGGVIEFSSRNRLTGAHRDAGMHPGIASDGTTISFYDFFNPFPPPVRRFNVSGVGRLGDSTGGAIDFYPYDYPDINAAKQIVFSRAGQTYKMSVTDRGWTPVVLGDIPRINDAGNIVVISAAHVQVFSAPDKKKPDDYSRKVEVQTGVWADINNKNVVVFEDFADDSTGRHRQVFKATPQRTVLLVHGTWSNHLTWDKMSADLTRAGYKVETVDFNLEPETRSNEISPRLQAKAVSRKINDLLKDDKDGQIDLVCHSLGGLAARWYLHDSTLWPKPDENAGVDHLILIGTPNWGTDLELVNPIVAVALAHDEGSGAAYAVGGGSYPSDTIDNWASGLRDMFAQWMPPPTASGRILETYSYPADPPDYKLAQWPRSLLGIGRFVSPIEYVTRVIVFIYLAPHAALKFGDTAALRAVAGALGRFATIPARLLLRQHRTYYNDQATLLGTVFYPLPDPGKVYVEGVNTRRVSPFLFELNSTADTSGARVFIIAGKSPVLSTKFGVPIPVLVTPYTIENDGIVPFLSAMGIEPINGKALFPASTDPSMHLIRVCFI